MTPESDLDEILDSVWHGCAVAAYLEQMAEEGRFPPDSEATKRRAFRYYEEELAAKNRAKSPASDAPSRRAGAAGDREAAMKAEPAR